MSARKPPARRQRPSTPDLAPSVGGALPMPAPMSEWRDDVTAAWLELWSTSLAKHFQSTDVPSLRRLFTLRSRLVDALANADAEPMITGSTGQSILSPWFAEAHRIEGEVERLEDRFGLTPQARLRLGVTLEEGLSLAARNRELLEAYRAGQEAR